MEVVFSCRLKYPTERRARVMRFSAAGAMADPQRTLVAQTLQQVCAMVTAL